MPRKNTLTEEEILEALDKYQGLVYLAASALGVTGQTIYNYAGKFPDIAQKIKELKQQRVDRAELALWNEVNGGNTQALMFFLRTQGKDRGYVERTEQDTTITVQLSRREMEKLPDEVLEQLAEGKNVDLTPYTGGS